MMGVRLFLRLTCYTSIFVVQRMPFCRWPGNICVTLPMQTPDPLTLLVSMFLYYRAYKVLDR